MRCCRKKTTTIDIDPVVIQVYFPQNISPAGLEDAGARYAKKCGGSQKWNSLDPAALLTL